MPDARRFPALLPAGCLPRRGVLAGVAGAALTLAARAQASVAWMPYRADEVMTIAPVLTSQAPAPAVAQGTPEAGGTRRIDPIMTDFEPATAAGRNAARGIGKLPPLGAAPPRAYVRVGRHFGVDPWLLFGVALQESQLKFGDRALPYPWTLCVAGRGLRFADYPSTLAALKRSVGRSTSNVDCGAMQVNWHWHSDKLVTFERALDPYPNLIVGAQILRGHFDARRDWRRAVALYHTGSDATAKQRARGARYAAQTLARLARMGVRLG